MNIQKELSDSFIEKNIPQKYYNEFKKAEMTLPFYFNLVDEIGANENAHSRILVRLFNYKDKSGTCILMKSFLDFFNINTDGIEIINNSDFNRACKEENGKSRYADVFFFQKTDDKSIGVIIENKINGAKDQDKQIDAYITSLKKIGIPKENIYIFYLVDQESERKKPNLQHDEYNEGRIYAKNYKLITYKEHVLNWLKHMLLPSVAYKEKYLIDSVKVYVTYLENRFKLIEDRKRIQLNVLDQFQEIRELDFLNLIRLEESLYKKFMEWIGERFDVFKKIKTQFIPNLDTQKNKNIKLEILRDDLIKITLHCDNTTEMLQYPSLEDGGYYKVIEIYNYEDINYALHRFCQLRNSSNIKAWIESQNDFELEQDYINKLSYIIAFQSAVKALIIDRAEDIMTKFSQICLSRDFSPKNKYYSFDFARVYYKTLNNNLSLCCELDIRAWRNIGFTIGIAKQGNYDIQEYIVKKLDQVNNNISKDFKEKMLSTIKGKSQEHFSEVPNNNYILAFGPSEKNLEHNYILDTILNELPNLIDLIICGIK